MSGCHPTNECKCICHLPDNNFNQMIKSHKNCCKCNTVISIEDKIKDLEDRIIKLEVLNIKMDNNDPIHIQLQRIDKCFRELDDRIKNIETHKNYQ